MSDVRDFGAAGDGQSDDTEAIRHAVRDGDGVLFFPRGEYRITEPIEILLDETGRSAVEGDGGTAKLIMAGAGPALRLVGTHGGTGSPNSAEPNVWRSQRMPMVRNLEIEGRHEQADGLECVETMQAILEGLMVRQCRHGIRLTKRNRNVLITHCHLYHNTGVGLYLDGVNLHQINVASSHISYNRLGGIRVERSQVRNLQITGNDIEYNNHRVHGAEPEPTAEIWVDTTGPDPSNPDRRASVAEVTVCSNTIQATPSEGGANIRIIGGPRDGAVPPRLWTISGNVIGNQVNNVHLTDCEAVTLSGNTIYSCESRNLLLEGCRQIVVNGNSFRRHTSRLGMGVRLVGSKDCTLSGNHLQDEAEGGQSSGASPLDLAGCERISVTGCQILDGVPYGLEASGSSAINVTGCTIVETRSTRRMKAAVRFRGEAEAGTRSLLSGNTLETGTEKTLPLDESARVALADNIVDGDLVTAPRSS